MTETKPAGEDVTLEKLAKDFRIVMQDAEALLKAGIGEAGDRAREARVRLAASLESAKANFHKVDEKAAAGAEAADKVIREHPYQSIGVAFGLGLLIGVLVTRR